jgi:hypothetical protein
MSCSDGEGILNKKLRMCKKKYSLDEKIITGSQVRPRCPSWEVIEILRIA